MIKIREKFVNSQNIGKFQFDCVTTPEILKLFKNIDDKKAAETNKTPRKLVKLSATVLFQPFTDAINNSMSKRVFLDIAKVASVFLFLYILFI